MNRPPIEENLEYMKVFTPEPEKKQGSFWAKVTRGRLRETEQCLEYALLVEKALELAIEEAKPEDCGYCPLCEACPCEDGEPCNDALLKYFLETAGGESDGQIPE